MIGGPRRLAIVAWAVLGVLVTLAEPAIRLGLFAAQHLRRGMTGRDALLLGVATLGIGYVEGLRGFRRAFCPRVVERAFALAASPRPVYVALAPLYAMSLVGAPRSSALRSWAVVSMVVSIVVAVRSLPETERAIVDAAVAVSLAWGAVELGVRYLRRLRRGGLVVPAMPFHAGARLR